MTQIKEQRLRGILRQPWQEKKKNAVGRSVIYSSSIDIQTTLIHSDQPVRKVEQGKKGGKQRARKTLLRSLFFAPDKETTKKALKSKTDDS